jgi:hypothetical protein
VRFAGLNARVVRDGATQEDGWGHTDTLGRLVAGLPYLHHTGLFGDEGWQLGLLGAAATGLFLAAGRGAGSRALVAGALVVALGTGTNILEVARTGWPPTTLAS